MARIMASNNVLCLCHHLQTRVVAGGGLEAGGPDPHHHCVPPQGSLMLFQTLLPNSPQTLSPRWLPSHLNRWLHVLPGLQMFPEESSVLWVSCWDGSWKQMETRPHLLWLFLCSHSCPSSVLLLCHHLPAPA